MQRRSRRFCAGVSPSRFGRALAIPLVLLILPLAAWQSIPDLTPGTAVSGKVSAGAVERYQLSAPAGVVIHVSLKSPGGQPGLTLISPASKVLGFSLGPTFQSLNADYYWQAPDVGTYRLELQGPAYLEAPLAFELMLESHDQPTEQDKNRVEGDRLIGRARAAEREKKFDDAASLFDAAFAQYEKAGDRGAQCDALWERDLLEQNSRRDFVKAIAMAEKAIAISAPDNDPWTLGIFQNAIGYDQLRLGQNDRAVSTLGEALEKRRLAGDVPGQAQTLANLGETLGNLSRRKEAVQAYEQSAALYRRAKNAAGERNLMSRQAFIEHQDSRFEDEIATLNRTIALAQTAKDRRMEGNLLLRKGQALTSLNRPRDAIALFQASAAAWQELNEARALGTALQELGRTYWSLGDAPNAKASLERAISARRTAQAPELSQSLTNLAAVLIYADNDYEQAQKLLDEALTVSITAKDEVNRSYVLIILGELANATKEHEKAAEYFRVAVTAANASGSVGQMAHAHRDRARELSRLQRFDEAIQEYETASSQFEKAAMPSDRSVTLVELGRTYASTNAQDRAQELYNEALQIRRGLKDRRGEANTLSAIGVAHRFVNEYDKAIAAFSEALSINQSLKDPERQASSLNYLGMTYGSIGSPRNVDCFKDALALLRPLGHSALEVSVLNNLAYHYDNRVGDGKRAVAYLEEAVAIDSGLRGGRARPVHYINLSHALLTAGDAARSAETAKQVLSQARRDGEQLLPMERSFVSRPGGKSAGRKRRCGQRPGSGAFHRAEKHRQLQRSQSVA